MVLVFISVGGCVRMETMEEGMGVSGATNVKDEEMEDDTRDENQMSQINEMNEMGDLDEQEEVGDSEHDDDDSVDSQCVRQ